MSNLIGSTGLVFGTTDDSFGLISNLSEQRIVKTKEVGDADGDTVGVEYPSKIANRQVELQLDRGQQQWNQCDLHDKCNVCSDRPDDRCV